MSGVRVGISNFRYTVGLFDCLQYYLLANVNVSKRVTFTFAICYMLSPVRLSVVCNARAPFSGGSNFRQ